VCWSNVKINLHVHTKHLLCFDIPCSIPDWSKVSRFARLLNHTHVFLMTRTRLASFSRSSHCWSGNASSLAENAFWGSRDIEQYCVRAVGTSHEVNGELSWTLPRCGRFRVNGIRVWLYVTLPQTWVVIFLLRGGFLTTPDSASSMAQRDNRHTDNG
jgi:hypothetical protein